MALISDTALFTELLYAGEFILKVTVAAFVSAIEDDREESPLQATAQPRES